jgi:4-hydroxy-tetrahydrodipicolinate synthase
MQTPFRDDDEIDEDVIRKLVNFIIEAGGHGLCWPQVSSEYYTLTEQERMRIPEVIVEEARGRIPVIIGVQSNFWKTSVAIAEHAEAAGADAIISIPPNMDFSLLTTTTLEAAGNYFKSLARAVSVPIFIQNRGGQWGPSLPIDMILDLSREYPHICYIKEEAPVVTHRISEYVRRGEGLIKGAFSGAAGKFLLNELKRGGAGSMTASGMTDVYVQIYNSYIEGDEARAKEIFDKLMSMLMFWGNFWIALEKEILRRRGVFKNTRMRVAPYKLIWDRYDQEEFELLFSHLKPYFTV